LVIAAAVDEREKKESNLLHGRAARNGNQEMKRRKYSANSGAANAEKVCDTGNK
jgi:hypothetical protein